MTAKFGGVDVVPLQGAIVACYGWGEQLWRSGRGAIANLCFISSFYIQGHQFHPDTQENNNECCFELLADVTVLYIDRTKIVFCYLGSMLV